MTLPRSIDVRRILDHRGLSVGPGPWHEITQAQVDQFAESTGDAQWIHVDAERAKAESPYGGTIAHGMLTLSMMATFVGDLFRWEHRELALNYGLDKVRWLTPVKVGQRVRGSITLAEVVRRDDGAFMVTEDVTVEVEGSERPACVARLLVLMRPAPG